MDVLTSLGIQVLQTLQDLRWSLASVKAIYEIVLVKKIMVKVNTRIPYVEGLHDVDHSFVPPNRSPTHVTTYPHPHSMQATFSP